MSDRFMAGATVRQRIRYWVNYCRHSLTCEAQRLPDWFWDGLRGWIRDWLRVTSDNEQIVAYCNGLRRDHDELAAAYRQLALQHQQLAGFAHETQRRLRWHEVGPLRVSKVALDKKDQERARREKVRLAETNGDGAEHTIEPVPEAERCPAIKQTDFGTFNCQLRTGHEDEHQSKLANGQRAQWPQDMRAATGRSDDLPPGA